MSSRTAKRLLTLALVALGIALVVLGLLAGAVFFGGGEKTVTTAPTETTIIPGTTPDVTADPDNQLEPAEEPEGELEGPGAHEDLRDEQPAGAPADAAEKVLDADVKTRPPTPLGGAQNFSCKWHPVVNFSTRASGSKVSTFVLHYTVSPPGSLDVIWGLFNRPAFGASSHLLLEPSGRCEQLVAFEKKAWTQGAFNSVAESVEIIATGKETRAQWLAMPIFRQQILAAIVVDRLRARGLPPKRVNPSGCVPLAGWTDHDALECGNSHTDVAPGFPYDVFAAQVRERFNAGQLVTLWRAQAGGVVLHSERAVDVGGVSGYDRLVGWMRNAGEAKVRAAEKTSGAVRIVRVTVAP